MEFIISVALLLGGLTILFMIGYYLTHLFWTRTIICIVAAIVSIVMSYNGMVDWIATFLMFFFLFGNGFGDETGETFHEYTINFNSGKVTQTTTKPTHTLGIIIGAGVSTVITLVLCDGTDFIPILVILWKVYCITMHIHNKMK